jgi:hypothetical protein
MKLSNLLLIASLTFPVNSYAQEKNKSPKIEFIMIDGKKSPSVVPLNPGEKYLVKVLATDPENDPLKVKWELFAKSELTVASQDKRKPIALPDMVTGSLVNVMLDVPVKQGAYRLILSVTDTSKNITTASIDLSVL